MLGTSTFKDGTRTAWLIGVAVVVVGFLLALACIGGNLAVWGQRISLRPVVVRLGRFSLSADITPKPSCAPLLPSDVCLMHWPTNGPEYFSIWVYITTRQGTEWDISAWHLVTLRLGPEG